MRYEVIVFPVQKLYLLRCNAICNINNYYNYIWDCSKKEPTICFSRFINV